jgi:hypothetical protein
VLQLQVGCLQQPVVPAWHLELVTGQTAGLFQNSLERCWTPCCKPKQQQLLLLLSMLVMGLTVAMLLLRMQRQQKHMLSMRPPFQFLLYAPHQQSLPHSY